MFTMFMGEKKPMVRVSINNGVKVRLLLE